MKALLTLVYKHLAERALSGALSLDDEDFLYALHEYLFGMRDAVFIEVDSLFFAGGAA